MGPPGTVYQGIAFLLLVNRFSDGDWLFTHEAVNTILNKDLSLLGTNVQRCLKCGTALVNANHPGEED